MRRAIAAVKVYFQGDSQQMLMEYALVGGLICLSGGVATTNLVAKLPAAFKTIVSALGRFI